MTDHLDRIRRMRDNLTGALSGELRKDRRALDATLAEVADLRASVIAFGGPWAAAYARDHGLPPGHLHSTHYDILARAGARMNDFIRGRGDEP